MPLIEYHCDMCDESSERIVKFTEADSQRCNRPSCRAPLRRNKITAASLRFKGNGWDTKHPIGDKKDRA